MFRKIFFGILTILILVIIIAGCQESKKSEDIVSEEKGSIAIDYCFPTDIFTEGEAICMRVVFRNNTKDTISLNEYPLKNLELFGPDGKPVRKVQRAPFAMPPRMWIEPGDSSWDIINLTGFFENSGPGMLAPGKYKVETYAHFGMGKYIRQKTRSFGYGDSVYFEIVPPTGEAKSALDEYRRIMAGAGGLDSLIGSKKIKLSKETRVKLDNLAEKYPFTPVGSRILINDLGIWYRSVPLERYSKFLLESPVDCPCCLHRHVIDRMIQRYVIKSEREDQLDLVEEALVTHEKGAPVGDYLRRAYRFRMEGEMLIR